MEKIVWHKGMACKRIEHGWRVRVWESKESGQRELAAFPRVLFVPLESDGEQRPCEWAAYDGPDVDLEDMERRALRAAEESARRARKNCRWKIKHAGFKQLLTLTYRENMTDLDRMRRDFAAWLRVMRRTIPGFRAVYGFEQQKRGAWHAHVACDRLPRMLHYRGAKVQSWKVGTAVWRGIVPSGGMCFVGGRDGRFNRYSSPGRIAGYISKYLTKDNAAGELGRRMWDSTRDLAPPPALLMDLPAMDIGDVIALAFQLAPGETVIRHALSRDGRCWWLYTEPDPGAGGVSSSSSVRSH